MDGRSRIKTISKKVIFTWFLCVFLCGIGFSAQSHAASLFCVYAPSMTPQCLYNDPSQCLEKAKSIAQGYCDINYDEITLPDGSGYFCLVTASRYIQCSYLTHNSCWQEMESKKGLCVRSNKRPLPNKEQEFEVYDYY